MYVHGIRALFVFEGYVVQKITMSGDLVQVDLRRDGRYRPRCPGCGGRMNVHRTLIQTARDLPLGIALHVILTYPAVQGRCKACGGFSTIHRGAGGSTVRFRGGGGIEIVREMSARYGWATALRPRAVGP